MASLHGFNSWEEIANYIENTLGINYTENPTSWVDAMKEEMQGQKFVKIVNNTTGQVTEQVISDSLYEGVGEFHIGENYQGQTIGGVKSAPTAKTVITNSSEGGTAVITEEAIGTKDTGIVGKVPAMNILSGLLQVYGLVHTGIRIANSQVWKDMSNYVYGTDFTDDTPLERVIDFLGMKVTNVITDHWHALADDDALRVSIPESIAKRMYEFLSNHMIQTQVPGLQPSTAWPLYYNFIHRTIELVDPNTYTLERFESVFANPSITAYSRFVDISDDVFKEAVSDFLQQTIATGFLVASSVSAALIDSMNGVYQFLKNQSVDGVTNASVCSISVWFNRGTTPPPADTPLSLSEFHVHIACIQDDTVKKTHLVEPVQIFTDMNIIGFPGFPTPASGYSYQAGDMTRYLKRGKTGESDTDYGYLIALQRDEYDPNIHTRRTWSVTINYPSNEQVMLYEYVPSNPAVSNVLGINGYGIDAWWGFGDYFTQPLQQSYTGRSYSNIGYIGTVSSYMPDDYLTYAGIRSKHDATGNPEKHPNPEQTMEEAYPQMQKKQNARPQAVTDPETGQTTVNNTINNYVSTSIPFGSENASRLINYGLNNNDDPNSYIDNRPQSEKAEGRINTNDPVDGFNEGTEQAVEDFNETRNDPYNYPTPIPFNQPNPQYPVNPPTETEGDSGDTPTVPEIGGLTASGMVSVYNPTKQEIIDFSSWLWSSDFFDNFIRLFANPMDAIIGLHILYATPITGNRENIIVGYLDSEVSSKVVTQQYFKVDCGTISIPEYYGNATDYEPYTTIHIYLPFIGIVPLKTNDVLGKQLHLEYGVDVMTGTCLAMLTTLKDDSKITCYTFAGNCAVQIPLSGGNYAQMITSLAGFLVGGVGAIATGNPIMALGAGASFMHGNVSVQHSGSIGSNAGACGTRIPYVIITRKVAYNAQNYQHYYGFPSNNHVKLGTCKGYTQVKSCHVESIGRATDNEKREIETLLKEGIIIV